MHGIVIVVDASEAERRDGKVKIAEADLENIASGELLCRALE